MGTIVPEQRVICCFIGGPLSACPLKLTRLSGTRCVCTGRQDGYCTFPKTWDGKLIRNPDATAQMITVDARNGRKGYPMDEQESTKPAAKDDEVQLDGDVNPRSAMEVELAKLTATPKGVNMYDLITDPRLLAAIDTWGRAIAGSAMFGCASGPQGINQGRMIAISCIFKRIDPLEYVRRNHLIGGNVTMRTDAMLADFRGLKGADHSVLSRTPEKAAVELKLGRKKMAFSFTWEEALKEPFVFCKDGKTPKGLWATPRGRTQMLWARVISDGVRVMAPEVNAGRYAPEEVSENATAEPREDAEDTPVGQSLPEKAAEEEPPWNPPEKNAASIGEAEVSIIPSPGPPQSSPPVVEIEATLPAGARMTHRAITGEAEGPIPPPPSPVVENATTKPTLSEMKQLRDDSGVSLKTWETILGRYGVTRPTALKQDEAVDINAQLQCLIDTKLSIEELEEWAVSAAVASEKPRGN